MSTPGLASQMETVFVQAPLMWPPTGVATADEPMRTLEAMARALETGDGEVPRVVNVFAGFAFADTPDTGVSFSAFTGDPRHLRRELGEMSKWAAAHRQQGNVLNPPIDEVMPRVLGHRDGPIVIVEPSDNIGGGAPGDGTGVLRALLKHGVDNSAVVINDPAAAGQCHAARVGDRLRLSIGGKSPMSGGPVELDVELLSTSDGRFELEDRHSHLASMYGVHIDMGPSAVVCHQVSTDGVPRGGIRILLTTHKTPPFDLGQLRSQGIVPEELFVIGVKAAVAHRRAYDPIAKASYTVETPGPCSSDLRIFPYRRIRRPIYPLDA